MSNLEKNNDNRKEEILANKSSKMGIYVAGTIVGAPMAFLSLITGEMATFFALITIYISFGAGELFATYRHFKQKRYLIGTIVIAIIAIGIATIYVEAIGLLPEWIPRWWLR